MPQHIDVTEIIRAMCSLLGRFADPRKLESALFDGVEVAQVGGDHSPTFLFRLVTPDNIQATIRVDMAEAFRGGRDYIEALVYDVAEGIEAERDKRAGESRIILLNPSPIAVAVDAVIH